MTTSPSLEVLESLIQSTIEPAAAETDRSGAYPRASIDALLSAGFGGLISAPEMGGSGQGFADAVAGVSRPAAACGSTAMIYAMPVCGTAAVETLGDEATRRAIATGQHLTTLAFSERGSRGQFWATLSTATADGDHVVLHAEKSWVTSAGEADSYVWTSKPVGADGPSTLWLVPASTAGLEGTAGFAGLRLRGNASAPLTAIGPGIRHPPIYPQGLRNSRMWSVLGWPGLTHALLPSP